MNKNVEKTIEELSVVANRQDLWDEFNFTNNNVNAKLLYLKDKEKETIRMLGPFVKMQRLYAPFKRYKNDVNIDSFVDRNKDEINKLTEYFKSLINDNKKQVKPYTPFVTPSIDSEYHKILKYLQDAEKGMTITWQNCLMVNVFMRHQNFDVFDNKVLILNNKLLQCIECRKDIKINGLFASDMEITRNNTHRNNNHPFVTEYATKILPPSHLTKNQINFLLNNGLIDIPVFLENLNKHQKHPYYYKCISDYKMPHEFIEEMIKSQSYVEENKALEHVEECLQEIPDDAFEKRNDMREAIRSLEV